MTKRILNYLKLTRYILPFIIAVSLVIVEGYTLSTSDFFFKNLLINLPLTQVDEIKFTTETEHIDADIVFFGDSSTLFDIIPSVVEKETGLKTYNLGITIDAFAHGEGFLLSHYLQHNHPPKYIVLHINPWTQVNSYDTSRLGKRDGRPQWEGIWITVRHGSLRDIAALFVSDPEGFVRFPLGALRLAGLALADHFGQYNTSSNEMKAKRVFEKYRAGLASNSGFLGLTEENGFHGFSDSCHLDKLEEQPDRMYIESVRRRFTTKDTSVLVFIAPIPDCDESLESLQHAYKGLADMQPRAMPSRYFQNQPYSAHTMLPGAIVNSQSAGSFIRELRSQGLP